MQDEERKKSAERKKESMYVCMYVMYVWMWSGVVDMYEIYHE